jgi:crotonobetainyl-CoA:carnitine CoA-transferase CaiB-like acyl-CoA transferase
MSARMLEGYRALDLTDEKGFLCGKILAELGVDVIKIEKPGGDPSRMTGPYWHDQADPEKTGLHTTAASAESRLILRSRTGSRFLRIWLKRQTLLSNPLRRENWISEDSDILNCVRSRKTSF